jgi:putative DNA methylase
MSFPVKAPRKLIEVALPLDAINVASAREKSIRHGHPSTLHLWWARRPLAAARAVIFAQMVNDPSWKWELEHSGEVPPGHLKASWAASRKRLFGIIEDLVKWANTTNEEVLERARAEIRKSWRETCEVNQDHPQAAELFNPDKLPGLHDPFAGGGTIPLEAQRLGLEAYASDLNPVAVLINKAMIEIPPRFAGREPVNPEWQAMPPEQKAMRTWSGAQGLAEDVRYYGRWMRDEAEKRIGHLYPKVEITAEMAADRPDLRPLVGQKLTVIAWLWARTVKSPNPAFRHVDVPLVSNFMLSAKEGKEAYVEPVVEGDSYRFTVKVGASPDPVAAKNGTKLARGANFRCLVSGSTIEPAHIYAEAQGGRMGTRLMAIVAEGERCRVYLPPLQEHEEIARQAEPTWKPEVPMPENPRWFSPPLYGLKTYGDLFTPRQLVALTTISEIVTELRDRALDDARVAGIATDTTSFRDGGIGLAAYAEAVSVYLGFCLDKATLTNTTQATWQKDPDRLTQAFGRQAIPMTWDYAEANPISDAGGGIGITAHAVAKVLERLPTNPIPGLVSQADATTEWSAHQCVISTDPPYYDNIGYAELSDYFYVWMRRTLQGVFPGLFQTIAVPKEQELIATPYRHGGKEAAESFFLKGMTSFMRRVAERSHAAYPATLYYAFKQSETSAADGTASTGWQTFLDAVIQSGLSIVGTWPMRTELTGNLKNQISALASSIILVCRPRPADAPTTSRRAFVRELNQILPMALDEMTRGSGDDRSPVAPVDLSQAIIGPGMAVFSKYAAVLEADGSPMSVKTALQLINRFLAEDDFDVDSQFCLDWFEQYGWGEGKFGEADTLARAKGTSVEGVAHTGVLSASGGVVRLVKWADYPADWDPEREVRMPVWESLHQLIRLFKTEGEGGAASVVGAVEAKAEAMRQLAYRLYTLCERAGWAEDARAYNEIVTSWNAIEAAAARMPRAAQQELFE